MWKKGCVTSNKHSVSICLLASDDNGILIEFLSAHFLQIRITEENKRAAATAKWKVWKFEEKINNINCELKDNLRVEIKIN